MYFILFICIFICSGIIMVYGVTLIPKYEIAVFCCGDMLSPKEFKR